MMYTTNRVLGTGAALAALSFLCGAALANAEDIVVGQCAALTGPASALGLGMQAGLKAALEEANAKGGVRGRKIKLLSADDEYEPEKCVDCTTNMIENSHVSILAGYVGTPTAKVAVPIVQESKTPLIGIFSGAMLLREPVQRYVLNVRASYDDETEELVKYLSDKLGNRKIAVLYQNDSFGLAGLGGTERALGRRGLKLAAKGAFERNTIAVKSGLSDILSGNPEAVVMVGPYKPVAEFVRQARTAGLKIALAAISFVGTENLIHELGAASDGIVISQVVPSPTSDLPVAKAYRQALSVSSPAEQPAYTSFEGYITGRLLVAGLEKADSLDDREKLVDAIESLTEFDLGGMTLSYSGTKHQGSTAVFMTRVSGGVARSLNSSK